MKLSLTKAFIQSQIERTQHELAWWESQEGRTTETKLVKDAAIKGLKEDAALFEKMMNEINKVND